MSMIFDKFPSRRRAEQFAERVKKKLGLDTQIFDTLEASDEHDPFPFMLYPPIVHVDRSSSSKEQAIQRAVEKYGGRFAGT